MVINTKILNDNATLPTRGSRFAAGTDLYAAISEPVIIDPDQTQKIGTGLALEIPEGYFGGIFARSGLATKQGLAPANMVGVVDSDYRGEIIVAIHNYSDQTRVITPNERIAQLVIIPYLEPTFSVTKELDNTDRGSGGFGSTGSN